MAKNIGAAGASSAPIFGVPGSVPVFREEPSLGPDASEHNKHQPVNTAREKQQRREYYRETGQGIRERQRAKKQDGSQSIATRPHLFS